MNKENTKKQAVPTKKECEKYELAITNFVLGEKMDITEKELFEHLAGCKNCQGDLRNWQATHAMLCAKEYDSRPEVKAKNEAFIKNLVYGNPCKLDKTTGNQSLSDLKSRRMELPGNRVLIDIKKEVKQDIVTISGLLRTHGELSIPSIVEKSNLKEYRVHNAICCMSLNDMILFSKDDKTAYAKLVPNL